VAGVSGKQELLNQECIYEVLYQPARGTKAITFVPGELGSGSLKETLSV
jgi:hypothetical protein